MIHTKEEREVTPETKFIMINVLLESRFNLVWGKLDRVAPLVADPPHWNFTMMQNHLRTNTNTDTNLCLFVWAIGCSGKGGGGGWTKATIARETDRQTEIVTLWIYASTIFLTIFEGWGWDKKIWKKVIFKVKDLRLSYNTWPQVIFSFFFKTDSIFFLCRKYLGKNSIHKL